MLVKFKRSEIKALNKSQFCSVFALFYLTQISIASIANLPNKSQFMFL